MAWDQALENIAAKAEQSLGGAKPGDYEENGLLYCGSCHTPKQTIIELFGQVRKVRCICECEAAAMKAEEEARKREERRREIARNRRSGFPQSDMATWTFASDDGTDPRTIRAMQAYVEHFPQLSKQGKGLLLYGPCGTGKTFAAACVVNALLDKGYTCLMTNFARITNTIAGMYDGKQEYLDSLNRYELLVLDDLGAERSTEYMNEMVFNIVDARYRANLPMIITSNLTGEDLKHPKNISEQRVFNRILERCHPIEVSGADRRRRKIREEFDEMKELLGL